MSVENSHCRKTLKICPICKRHRANEYIPYIDGVSFNSAAENEKMLACEHCFHAIWAREK